MIKTIDVAAGSWARDDRRAAAPRREVLTVEGLSKSFGATQALRDASLTVCAGEVHILLGENGAGKSTLGKIVAGIHSPDSGRVLIEDQVLDKSGVEAARRAGIAIVFQELSLAPHLSVAENLFLGSEAPRHPFTLLRRRKEAQICADILSRLELAISPDRAVNTLSIAEKQMLEIGKALLQSPRLLIMDEPTSTLTEREKGLLFKVVAKLKQAGVAILYVTHHLREVFEIGDRVSAMTDGAIRMTIDVTDNLTEGHLLEMLTGKKLSVDVVRTERRAGAPILSVRGLVTKKGRAGIDMAVRSGEVVGVYGVVGCGRETLGRTLVGVARADRGHIDFEGRPFRPRHPADALRLGVGYLPMDRKERGILPSRPIRENLTLTNLQSFSRHGVLSANRERTETQALLSRVQVRYGSMEHEITSLSGGNQQKVLFGRAISPKPRLLVMEDPTAGIDMGARLDLYRQIRQLADNGMSFLLLSSDLVETLLLCDRIYTMYQGQIVDEIVAPSLDDEERALSSIFGRDGPSRPTTSQLNPGEE